MQAIFLIFLTFSLCLAVLQMSLLTHYVCVKLIEGLVVPNLNFEIIGITEHIKFQHKSN